MKMNKLFSFFGFVALLFLMVSCKGEGTDAGQQQPNAATTPVSEETVNPVAWNDLQALIPAKAAGMDKTNVEDDKSSLGNVGFSHALGVYEKGDRKVEIQIVDSGMRKIILTTLAPWREMTSLNILETNGYEKYAAIGKYPGYESVDRALNTVRLSVLVEGRFIILLTGQNVALEELQKVMKDIDLDKIAAM